jgi:hypothetical protein
VCDILISQGDAVIIPAYSSEEEGEAFLQKFSGVDIPESSIPNELKLIKWLISAPTMRVPEDVSNTVAAYLAFRAVILAGNFLNFAVLLIDFRPKCK